MTSRPETVPMPAAVAARPRDSRGYPIPAITPWRDGQPLFADQSSYRLLICLMERRCSVCGTTMERGPVWRVIDGDTAESVALALEMGKPLFNIAPAVEGPGHRACMIYSAMVCPHLASPYSRRSKDANAAFTAVPKGDARGEVAGVVAYEGYDYRFGERGVEIYFEQPVELLPYGDGEELRTTLEQELARPERRSPPCPPYLLDDEAAARQAFTRLVRAASDDAQPVARARQEQRRKDQRKAGRAAPQEPLNLSHLHAPERRRRGAAQSRPHAAPQDLAQSWRNSQLASAV